MQCGGWSVHSECGGSDALIECTCAISIIIGACDHVSPRLRCGD